MKKTILMISWLLTTLTIFGQISRTEISENIMRSGSNYYAYPGPEQKELTPPPSGYEAYYISHYGRHGSRHLISDSDYDLAYKALFRADSLGELTPFGEDIFRRICTIREDANLRHGELTLLGAEQHRGIARRMYERFPEVFAGKTHIDAKSTDVIRCILSMENALQELCRLNPELEIRHDASRHDMWYMNHSDRRLDQLKEPESVKNAYDKFCKRHQNYDGIMRSLFKNEKYWRNQVNWERVTYHLFKLASNLQSTELRHGMTLYDIFNESELYDLWLQTNAWWYIHYGPYPLNGGVSPYSQRNLLGMIIQEADSCLRLPHPGATLRYGHEVCVMPLACLLELDDWGKEITDLEQLDDEGWRCYKIFPMGCNIQMIFYRPTTGEGDILMKVLLNENEARLPLQAVSGPYYKWNDFKKYFLKKLEREI